MGSFKRSQNKSQLRKQLLRGASVAALVTALSASQASAQSLSALRAAVAGANAQAAKLMQPVPPASPSQNSSSPLQNTATMNAAQARALQYQSQVSQAISLEQQAQAAARA